METIPVGDSILVFIFLSVFVFLSNTNGRSTEKERPKSPYTENRISIFYRLQRRQCMQSDS